MANFLRRCLGWGLLLVLAQPSCGSAERVAFAAEPEAASCALGSLVSVSRCGGAEAACHVCGRIDPALGGQCLQPCVVGGDPCPGAQTCHPMTELLASGYARVGECPAGYCL